jgi:hypothetical protein
MRLLGLCLLALSLPAQWRTPASPSVRLTPEGKTWKINSDQDAPFLLLSEKQIPASPGETFQIDLRIKVDIHTVALPELVCFDAGGKEIPRRSALEGFTNTTTTNWQRYRRVFAAQPGTAAVNVGIRGAGKGEIRIENPELKAVEADTYQTGVLYSPIHPRLRRGLVLESNLGIQNIGLLSEEDTDGDGKWAEVQVDLDKLSEMETKGEDWRTRFEYDPNVIYWSDGAVLKSDSVHTSRAPDVRQALHFRMRAHRGPYRAILSDPGRAAAVSTDGKSWRRIEGGAEAELGILPAPDGLIEIWMDACYRDQHLPGPVYFDYVRLFPAEDPASAQRLFTAARQRPAPATRSSVEEKRVRVRVEAPAFENGVNWPVRCGLPIPRGELASAEQAAVLSPGGRRLPSQNRAPATWPDGSVKWLFLDFQHDFSASARAEYSVSYGSRVRAVEPPVRVSVLPTQLGMEVDTGAIRFRVPKSRFGLIEQVRRVADSRTLQNEPVSVEIVESSGRRWRALERPVERLILEQAGPLHAVILAETQLAPSGKPATGFFHRARIHAYAGSPLVEVDYFAANADSRDRIMVRKVALQLKTTGAVSGEGEIVQAQAEPARPGWISPRGGSLLSIGVANFREQYPKALRWSPAGFSVDLWAPEGGEYEWIQGVGKTHHVALYYGLPAGDADLLAHGPVLALAEPEWYVATGAFGHIETAAANPHAAIEETLARHMNEDVVKQVGLGFENYGDHSSSGYVKGSYLWDNNEYDLPAGALIHFARTGDRNALRIGLASALHYADVDTIHYSSQHAGWAGAAHTHSHTTFGHHTAEAPNMHHAGYVQGMILSTYFTGEPEGLSAARSIADWALANLKPESNTGVMERALGHPLMTLNDVYEATWDDTYLRGAARLVDWAMKWEHPGRGGFLAPITEQPAFYSGSPFCGGLITAALLKFNSWARLPEIDQLLERTARWVLTDMWRPPGAIMSKGGSPRRTAEAQNISSHLRMIREVYVRTEDPLFLAVPRQAVLLGFGKDARRIGTRSTGLVYNYLPWFLPVMGPDDAAAAGLKIAPARGEIEMAPGSSTAVCFDLSNHSSGPLTSLRASFQARPDFEAVPGEAPAVIEGGRLARSCYPLRAPEKINLTSAHNRVSYAHCSAVYRHEGALRTAHASVKITLR